MSAEHDPSNLDHLFLRKSGAHSDAVLWLLGGIGMIVFGIIGAAVSLFTDISEISRQLVTTLPLLLVSPGCWRLGLCFALPARCRSDRAGCRSKAKPVKSRTAGSRLVGPTSSRAS